MFNAQIKAQISDILKTRYGVNDPVFDILPTGSLTDGDFYTNVALRYAKDTHKNPAELANEVAGFLKKYPSAGSVQSDYRLEVKSPGFINFILSDEFFGKEVGLVLDKKGDYGKGKPLTEYSPIVVEYSSPNIAKPFGVGHLRSTFIGDSVVRLLKFSKNNVITDNHLGDWGTQYGKLAYAVEKWGNLAEIKKSKNPIKDLVDLYVKFHDEADKNPKIEDERRAYFKKLEQGDKKIRELWQFCVDISLEEFSRLYARLGILEFDNLKGESYFEDKMPAALQALRNKKLTTIDKGAELVYFDEKLKMPPLMIIKSDKTTLYATRDLATDKERLDLYGKNTLIINEVGSEQSLYFEQLFKTEELLGWVKKGQRIHIKHGLFRFKDGKMSTRKGKIIFVEDVLNEALGRSLLLIKDSKDFTAVEKETVAEDVAVGALKWNDLKREAHKDIIFDWDELLNLQGNSGPYVQYTFARCTSVINNSKLTINNSKINIQNDDERDVLRILSRFSIEVERATNELSPHFICHYLYNLCQTYNSFYAKHKIVGSSNEKTRLIITKAAAQVIKNGLGLLGIKAPERM